MATLLDPTPSRRTTIADRRPHPLGRGRQLDRPRGPDPPRSGRAAEEHRSSSPSAPWSSRSCSASSSSTCSPRSARVSAAGSGPRAESAFATVLVPGVVGISIMFQGIQAVAMQMAQEFGFTREIEDRVQAPCPIWLVAMSKVLSGSVQGLISASSSCPSPRWSTRPGVDGPLYLALVDHRHGGPAVVRGHDLARPAARDLLRAPQHRPDVRLRRPAHHLPGRDLLPVDPPGSRSTSAASTGSRSSC